MIDNAIAPFRTLAKDWNLIRQFTWREVTSKYKGSFAGLAWAALYPILLLGVYTFVFSVVFQARWNAHIENRYHFALVLFAGLTTFGLFAETVGRSIALVTGNANYVKKVVFPLEALAWSNLLAGLVQTAISLAVFLIAEFFLLGSVPVTALLYPIVILPLVLLILGLSWLLSASNVYLRDIAIIVPMLLTVMMFLSPIFYPLTAVPPSIRPYLAATPLAFAVESAQNVLLFGRQPDWWEWLTHLLVAALVMWVGYAWFQRVRRGFADVI